MENKKIKVYWIDAVIYSASSVAKKLELKPNKKMTEGILEQKSEWGIVVRDPHTTNIETGGRDSREKTKKTTFLFIPHEMVEKIE